MSIHYKFKNTINYDAVKFDGVYISGADLKAVIVQQKKMGQSELQVENEETGQVYADDQLIPKNTNVIVSRLPPNTNKRARMMSGHQHHHNNHSNGNHNQNSHHNHHHNNHSRLQPAPSSTSTFDHHNTSLGGGREAQELVSSKNMSEEERIKYVQSQSTKDFDPTKYAKSARGGHRPGGRHGAGGSYRHFVPGPGYVCKKCGIPGHSIYDCKMSSMHKVKRSSGIPRDFLMKVDSKEKGALMTPSGEYAVPFIDREAYNNPKIEKAPFFEDALPSDGTGKNVQGSSVQGSIITKSST